MGPLFTLSNFGADGAPSATLATALAVRALDALVVVGRARAVSRWELELVAWLDDRRWAVVNGVRAELDLIEVAWTPDHFADQQQFLLGLCDAAAARPIDDPGVHGALTRVRGVVAAHRRSQVAYGRRWRWLCRRPELPPVAAVGGSKP